MARAISVKVPTADLIAQIESKIAQIDADTIAFPAKYAEYKQQVKDYKFLVLERLSDYLYRPDTDKSVVEVGNGWRGDIQVSISESALALPERPVEPERPNERKFYGREHLTPKEMLEKTLKVLKMTKQEEVNSSTYSSIVELL